MATNRMVLFVLWAVATFTSFASAQDPPGGTDDESSNTILQESVVDADTDPTKPVFLGLRHEYFNFEGGGSANVFILRKDQAILERKGRISGRKGFITRFDFPIVISNNGTDRKAGIGDLYGQVLWVPYLTRKFGVGVGSGIVIPTATDRRLGSGKLQAVPTVVPIWFFKRKGYFLVRFQEFISIAGSGSRPGINSSLVVPTYLRRVGRKWWVSPDTEIKSDWKRGGKTGFKSGFKVGRMLSPKLGVWVKPEISWGNYPGGGWSVRSAMVFHRP